MKAFSYNSYIAQTLFMATVMARRTLKAAGNERIMSDKKGQKKSYKEEAGKLIRRYFADFIRLAGVDPAVMEEVKIKTGFII